jgi:hypothetical protein
MLAVKRIENRSWPARADLISQRIAIHTSAGAVDLASWSEIASGPHVSFDEGVTVAGVELPPLGCPPRRPFENRGYENIEFSPNVGLARLTRHQSRTTHKLPCLPRLSIRGRKNCENAHSRSQRGRTTEKSIGSKAGRRTPARTARPTLDLPAVSSGGKVSFNRAGRSTPIARSHSHLRSDGWERGP